MSEWQETELGLACDRVTGRLNSNAAVPGGKYPFFTCSPETLAIDNFAFDAEVLLLAGNNANGVFPLKYYKGKFNAYQRTYVITPKGSTDFDTKFLYYQLNLRLNYFKEISQGTATKFLTAGILDNLPILYPEIDEQKAIAEILSSLDEKIELNRKQNRTLEAIAQALFKRWFVEFEFPDENGRPYKSSGGAMQPSELGEIPAGWEVGCVDDVCARIFSGGTPNTRTVEYWNGGIPWLSSGETRQRFILGTEKTITQSGVDNSSTRLARSGSIVIASAGQGKTRGQTSYLGLNSYINQSVVVLEADRNQISDSYLFFNLAPRYEQLRQLSDSQSIRGSLTTKLLAQIAIVKPPKLLVDEFDGVAKPIIDKIVNSEKQNISLSDLRDILLPKLMSGELQVPTEDAA